MKKLSKIIHKKGFIFQRVHRTEGIAMYALYIPEWSLEEPYAYEVFKIKIQKERYWNGKLFPEKERFPSNEDFGYSAWTFYHYEKAYWKYEELVAIQKP